MACASATVQLSVPLAWVAYKSEPLLGFSSPLSTIRAIIGLLRFTVGAILGCCVTQQSTRVAVAKCAPTIRDVLGILAQVADYLRMQRSLACLERSKAGNMRARPRPRHMKRHSLLSVFANLLG